MAGLTTGRRAGRSRAAGWGLLAIVTGALAAGGSSPAADAASTMPRVDRLLVVTLPTVTWSDLRHRRLPNLERLFRTSALGDLSLRIPGRRTGAGDGYATLGAGARAVDARIGGGLGFEVGEPYGVEPAGAVYRRQTGHPPGGGLVDLSLAEQRGANRGLLYGAKLGALGDALARHDVTRAVVANADAGELVQPPERFARPAIAALMGGEGRVPAGRLGSDLLVPDVEAPFGRRYDNDAVVAAFRRAWSDRTNPARQRVVLVEASELWRTERYAATTTAAQQRVFERRALERSDRLVGRLLRDVDLTRDGVLVVSPAQSERAGGLGVAALHAPGVRPGLLRSATTRRAGFVQLVDVAPTVLERLGYDAPGSMEGRPFEVSSGGVATADRGAFLADANDAAAFRDRMTPLVTTVFVLLSVAASGAAVVAFSDRSPRFLGLRRIVEWWGLALVGFLAATYLAGAFAFDRWGAGAYWLFLVGVALAWAGVAERLGRGDELLPAIVALGGLVALFLVDVPTGARLQFNTALGYSPTVAGRFAGIGNLAYSALGAAAILLAGLVAHRLPGRRGRRLALGILAVTVLVDGLPMWGADVGGVLSMVPAFGLVASQLLGWRVRWRAVVAWLAIAVVAVVGLGFLDLSRPADQRTHLGRLFEHIGHDGFSSLTLVVERKAVQNLGVLTGSMWTVLIPVVFAFIAYLVYRSPGRLRIIQARIPELRFALSGFLVLAVLGFALNDSGIAIPGVMLGVLNAVLIVLAVRAVPRSYEDGSEVTGAEVMAR